MAESNPTKLPKGVPEDEVDALYGLPSEEFTPTRDALAKELRGSGKRDEADWVKGLKKPSAAAALVNQLARQNAGEAKRVLESAEAVRAAQDRALAGKAGAGELAEASEEHSGAMRALLAKAPSSASAATLERVAETLRAVALDEDARAGFASARLTRELRAAGLGFLASGDGPAPPPRAAKKPAKAKPEKAKPDPKAKARAKAALDQAKAGYRSRRDQTAELERDLRQAERDAESAQRRLEKASAALARAREKEADAKARVEEAEAASEALTRS